MMAWLPAEAASGPSLVPLPEGGSAHVAIFVSGICMIVLNMCSAALALCDTEDTIITGHLRPLHKCLQPPECRGFLFMCSAGQPHSCPTCYILLLFPPVVLRTGGKSGWKGHYSTFQTPGLSCFNKPFSRRPSSHFGNRQGRSK